MKEILEYVFYKNMNINQWLEDARKTYSVESVRNWESIDVINDDLVYFCTPEDCLLEELNDEWSTKIHKKYDKLVLDNSELVDKDEYFPTNPLLKL